tara:strand:- start:790 stop:1125 length:336 start_codon:yes stop_codon:yes gene_type:complete
MTAGKNHWTKSELQIYILLLCANADEVQTEAEMNLIKSKTDPQTFEKLYQEFSGDTEDESLEKIHRNVQLHDYSNMELIAFRKEMDEIFFTDKNFTMMERNLDRILDNILY